MTEHVGNDFSRFTELDLLPMVDIHYSAWSIQIDYSYNDKYISTSYVEQADKLFIRVGQDVFNIKLTITNIVTYQVISYDMRVDHLMMLNMLAKLIKVK